MTPKQYYFPYFFSLPDFKKELKQFKLSAHYITNDKTKIPDTLVISARQLFDIFPSKENLLSIPFGATLMFENNKLFYWLTDHNTIDITQVDLCTLDKTPELLNTKIDISNYNFGSNKSNTYLDTDLIVTYLRKDSITYNQEYFEKFVIIFIEKTEIKLIRFDWFNKTGGDYGYVWPATARLDEGRKQIHGQGMRMSDFVVEVDYKKASL